MICFVRTFFGIKDTVIRLKEPDNTIIFTGARKERIDAVIGSDNRIERLIIHTRQRGISRRPRRWFA